MRDLSPNSTEVVTAVRGARRRGLKDRSNRPHHSPGRKLALVHIRWILNLRKSRRLGPQRIQRSSCGYMRVALSNSASLLPRPFPDLPQDSD